MRNYLVYGSFNGGARELRRVTDDTYTYIPTTTIGISDDSVDDGSPEFCEYVNILSSKVKNTLFGSSSENKTWTLDSGKIRENTNITVNASILSGEDIDEYEMQTGIGDYLYFTEKNGAAYGGIESGSSFICGSVDRASGKITFSVATSLPV